MFQIDIQRVRVPELVDDPRWGQAIERVLAQASLTSAEVSLAVVDDPTIRELNGRYLQHDYETDVLSFVLEREGAALVGEIIVSHETAVRVAGELGRSADDELLLYVIHGALHLAGYDDLTDTGRQEMRELEAEHLACFGVMWPAGFHDEYPPHATVPGEGREPARGTRR